MLKESDAEQLKLMVVVGCENLMVKLMCQKTVLERMFPIVAAILVTMVTSPTQINA